MNNNNNNNFINVSKGVAEEKNEFFERMLIVLSAEGSPAVAAPSWYFSVTEKPGQKQT